MRYFPHQTRTEDSLSCLEGQTPASMLAPSPPLNASSKAPTHAAVRGLARFCGHSASIFRTLLPLGPWLTRCVPPGACFLAQKSPSRPEIQMA